MAQHSAFSRQIPLMYLLIMLNTWIVAFVFRDQAPPILSLYGPAVLSAVCVWRLVTWWRSRWMDADVETALKTLRRTNKLTIVLGGLFASWAYFLLPYGDAYSQSHMAFYIAVTVLGCVLSLIHVRSAALLMILILNLVFVVFFGFSDNIVFSAETLNLLLVSLVVLFILRVNYTNFEALVESRTKLLEQQNELLTKQEETQKLSDENFHLANMDSLTGLPNRRCFFSRLDAGLSKAEDSQSPLLVGALDLNGFKAVNDIFGHAAGDKLLAETGRRLREICGDAIFASRLGGDEFGFLIEVALTDDEILEIGEGICGAFREPFVMQEGALRVSGSVGFARWMEGMATRENIYEKADYALYAAKTSRKDDTVLFGPQHEHEIFQTTRLERSFGSKNFADEISVVFQPVIDLESHKVVAFEALARWNCRELGEIPPDVFISVAERTGFIDHLTMLLFEKALTQMVQWPEEIRLSFNLSAKNVASRSFAKCLTGMIEKFGIEPSRIDFEITETAMIRDFEKVQDTIKYLRQFGSLISLDDFGTGFSSLVHLHRLPLDKIKVDRSFVSEIDDNPVSRGIIKSLLILCREMGIGCIIEGIETERELETVRALGGPMAQGFYFSRPIAADQVAGYLGQDAENMVVKKAMFG